MTGLSAPAIEARINHLEDERQRLAKRLQARNLGEIDTLDLPKRLPAIDREIDELWEALRRTEARLSPVIDPLTMKDLESLTAMPPRPQTVTVQRRIVAPPRLVTATPTHATTGIIAPRRDWRRMLGK